MATGTLTGTTIASTYKSLLKVKGGANTILDGDIQIIEDGDGVDSVLGLATDSALISGNGNKLYFYDADGDEHISADNAGVLSIAAGAEIDLTATAVDLNGTLDVSGAVGLASSSGVTTIGSSNGLTVSAAGVLTVNSATDSTSKTTGSTIIDGGVGIAKTLYVGTGIVEEGGVLKENLLTNSGFDVWSNSTLVNVGDDLVVNGAFGSNVTGWVGSSGNVAHDTDKMKVTATAPYGYGRTTAAITVVPGKLYRLKYKYQNTASEIASVSVYNIQSTGNYANNSYSSLADLPDSTSMSAEQTWIFEAEAGNTTIYLGFHAKNNTDICWFDDISLYEVTPGCVGVSDSFDGWQRRGGTSTKCWRQHSDGDTEAVTKVGSFYSLKTISTTSAWNHAWPNATLITDLNFLARFAGRKVTAGCWVYSTLATPEIRLNLYTGSDNLSTQTVSQNTWTWLEVTATCPDALANFQLQFYKSNNTSETYYISQPMLVFGNSIGEGNYTRPQGEIVWFENYDDLTDYTGAAISSNATINLEVQSNGVIPKGAKAVYCNVAGQASALDAELVLAQASDANERGTWMIAAVATPRYVSASGWVPCDSNGDIGVWQSAAWADARIRVTGVELR